MINSGMFASATDLWETPQWLFDEYDNQYHFEVDVCAIPGNAKCEKYYTPEQDGLSQEWIGGAHWCNPPYGKEIVKWVEKAANAKCVIVMLLPARTDTKWFHDYVLPYGEITFLRGRLKFGNSKNSAPFPSMIVVFHENTRKEDIGNDAKRIPIAD